MTQARREAFSRAAAFLLATAVACAAAAPARATLLAVVDRGIIYRSNDDGFAWSAVGTIAESDVVALRPSSDGSRFTMLTRAGDIHVSDDAGATWTLTNNAGARDCVDLAIARDGEVYVLTRTGDLLWITGSGSVIPLTNAGFADGSALSLGAPAGGGVDSLFAVTASGDVSACTIGGGWTNTGNTGYTPVVDIMWRSSILYALTDAGEFLRSTNSGVTWSATSTISQVGMRAFTFVGDRFRAISRQGDVTVTSAGSWTWIGAVNQMEVVALSPGQPEDTSVSDAIVRPPNLALRAWPNPFTSELRFSLGQFDGGAVAGASDFTRASESVDIGVYDATGRLRERVFAGPRASLPEKLAWNAHDLPAGVYFVRARAGGATESQRIVRVR